jgi:tellurite resistance protein TerC
VSTPLWWWVAFHVFVFAVLVVDLVVVRRNAQAVTARQAGAWTAVWIFLSLAFCGLIWRVISDRDGALVGNQKALEFLTGYVVEYALSVDNLFVFLMVFGYFKVKPEFQHRLLFWGIIGAFVMRASLIIAGAALVHRFHFLLYVFGAFLLYTAWKLLFTAEDDEVDPENGRVLKLARRVLPVAQGQTGGAFLVRQEGRAMVTPLFLILLVVETTDLLFALDSIPAILGITQDPFIVYTSNVCAILGLRSLFFLVASLMSKFHYLKAGLAGVLAFVGLKMIGEEWVPLAKGTKILLSLGIIVGVLGASVLASMLWPKKQEPPKLTS